MNTTELTVSPNEDYFILMNTTGTGIDYVGWRQDETAPTYTGGLKTESTDAGATWTTQGRDQMFRIWGEDVNPSATQLVPANQTTTVEKYINFSALASPGAGQTLQNATLNIWNSSGDLFYELTNSLSSTVEVQTDYNVTNLTADTYTWLVRVCDSTNCSSSVNWTLTVDNYALNQITYSTTTSETAQESFTLNLSILDKFTISSGTLTYNNLNYSATVTQTDTSDVNNWNLTVTTDIPTGDGNFTFNWSFVINGTGYISDQYGQLVNETIWQICNATFTEDYLNITFRDETTEVNTNASVSSATFEYYLGSGTVTKTYTYTNATTNDHYRFCASPSTQSFNVKTTFPYYQGTLYPQRIWNNPFTAYTNTMATQILYLLHSDNGIYVTLQVTNPSNQIISDVFVNATASIGGTETLVGNATTGGAGTVTFWLDPNKEHTFGFFKSGYDTLFSTFFPTQTTYTVVMTGGTSSSGNDYAYGIDWDLRPVLSSDLVNGTVYDFNLTLTSSFWDLDEYGLILKMANGTTLNSTSTVTSGTLINLKRDTADLKQVVAEVYWVINGETETRVVVYNIRNTGYAGWSLTTFFTDLDAYLDDGLFGLDNFGRNFIIFIVLLFSIGIMGFKFGFTNLASITFMTFAIIFFFDVVVGLLPNPVKAIPNFLTFASGLITAIVVYREVSR